MDAQKFQRYVEEYMDTAGLANVLSEVAEVCALKSEHVATNWQDQSLADRWTQAHDLVALQARNIDDPLA